MSQGSISMSQSTILSCSNCGFSSIEIDESPTDTPEFGSRRLHELATSNVCPLEAERDVLQSLVNDDSAKLQRLSEQIVATREALQNLHRSYGEIQDRYRSNGRILHPLRRLPPEILREIFMLVVGEEDIDMFDQKAPPQTKLMVNSFDPLLSSRWILSRVCSRWRTVALGCSRLWARVQIKMPLFNDRRLPHSAWNRFIAIQLHRASSHPLSVTLIQPSFDSLPKSIIDVLLPSCSRWSDFAVSLRPSSFQMLADVPPFLTSLKRLFFHLPIRDSAQEIDVLSNILRFARPLTVVVGTPGYLGRHGNQGRLARAKEIRTSIIDEGSMRCSRPNRFLSILQEAPELEAMGVLCRKLPGVADQQYPASAFTHAKLQSLDLVEPETGIGIGIFMSLVDLPALTSLKISGDLKFDCLRSFLERSKCSLKEFSLASSKLSIEDGQDVCSSLPSTVQILKLKLTGEHLTAAVQALGQRKDLLSDLKICFLAYGGKNRTIQEGFDAFSVLWLQDIRKGTEVALFENGRHF